MNHVEQGQLQAYLDHEVPSSARAQIDAHVRACDACAAEVAALQAAAILFHSTVKSVDVAAPMRMPLTQKKRAFAMSRSSLAKAAVLVIAFGALGSAAIPGSPMRSWITGALRSVGVLAPATRAPQPAPESVPAPTTATAPATESGISITPDNQGSIRVVVTQAAANTLIRVRLVDTDRAKVQALGARFSTAPGRIEIVDVRAGEVAIELPRNAKDARVVVDGKTVFQKDQTAQTAEFVYRTGH